MINEDNLTPHYQKIAKQLNDIIPIEWYELKLYAEDSGSTRTAIFYFKENKDGVFISSGQIPQKYNVDMYFDLIDEVSQTVRQLRKEFINQGMDPFIIFEFYLNNIFEFNANYQYQINQEIGGYERQVIWAYETLGVKPKDKNYDSYRFGK